MEKKLYLMESFVTYVNKGSITIDTNIFPEFEGKTNEEIQKIISEGNYCVDIDLGTLMPKNPSNEILEQLGYLDENGVVMYDENELVDLWVYHNESDVDFDRIKNEESYIIVSDH